MRSSRIFFHSLAVLSMTLTTAFPAGAWVATRMRKKTKPSLNCQIFLVNGTTFTVPPGWTATGNKIEVIGAGGGGGSTTAGVNWGGGAGGGGYSQISNLSLIPGASVTYSVGLGGAAASAGGDTWFNGASYGVASVGAKGGGAGATNAGGTGGAAASGIGTLKYSGGNGGYNVNFAYGGGGGAAGSHGAGAIGQGATNDGGGGVGDAGFGGAANGGAGQEWDGTHGSGGGGSRGGPSTGAVGGLYGGGGGAGGNNGSGTQIGGAGAQGLIVVTYSAATCGYTFAGAGTNGDPYRSAGETASATTTAATSCEWYRQNATKDTYGTARTPGPTAFPNLPNNNGVYRVTPNGAGSAMNVYCDMINSGGGWTLIMASSVADRTSQVAVQTQTAGCTTPTTFCNVQSKSWTYSTLRHTWPSCPSGEAQISAANFQNDSGACINTADSLLMSWDGSGVGSGMKVWNDCGASCGGQTRFAGIYGAGTLMTAAAYTTSTTGLTTASGMCGVVNYGCTTGYDDIWVR